MGREQELLERYFAFRRSREKKFKDYLKRTIGSGIINFDALSKMFNSLSKMFDWIINNDLDIPSAEFDNNNLCFIWKTADFKNEMRIVFDESKFPVLKVDIKNRRQTFKEFSPEDLQKFYSQIVEINQEMHTDAASEAFQESFNGNIQISGNNGIKHSAPRRKDGTVIKRKIKLTDGSVVTRFDARKKYTKPDGTPGEKSKRFETKPAANKALKDFAIEIAQEAKDYEENKGKPKNHTFGELVEYFKKHYVKEAVYVEGKRLEGYKASKGNINYLKYQLDKLKSEFGTVNVRELTYEDIRLYKIKFQRTPNYKNEMPAQSTINNFFGLFRRVLNVGIQKQWLDSNPFKHGDTLISKKGVGIRTRILSFDEEKRLFAACRKHIAHVKVEQESGKIYEANIAVDREHLIPLITVAIDTAMRVGEIFNMRRWQADFENRVIYITDQAAIETKTEQPGILPMTDRVYEVLMEKSKDKNPEDKLFEKFSYARSFGSACKEAGIKDFQFRDFRATCASRMTAAGIAKDIIKKTTRHSDKTDTFEKIYVRVDVEMAQLMGKTLNNFYRSNSDQTQTEKKAA